MKVSSVVLVESREHRSFLRKPLLMFRVLCRTRMRTAQILCTGAKTLSIYIALSANVSNGVAFVFLISGQASLHGDNIV